MLTEGLKTQNKSELIGSKEEDQHCGWMDHFTVVSLVTWPLNGSEPGDDLVLIQTSLLLLYKSSWSFASELAFTWDKQRSVSKQGQLHPPLHSWPGNEAYNCKMACSHVHTLEYPSKNCKMACSHVHTLEYPSKSLDSSYRRENRFFANFQMWETLI